MLRNSRVSKNVPLLLWWPQSPYASPLLALAWADRITWQHAWVIIQKKTTPEKQTVKCTWTAVLTPKPTTTERIKTPDWRDSNRKIQRCSQIISIMTNERLNPSGVCVCLPSEAGILSSAMQPQWPRLCLHNSLLHCQTADLNICCTFLVTVQWNLRGKYR